MIKSFELRRNLFHIFYGFIYVLLIYFNIFGVIELLILFLIGIVISLLSKKFKIPLVHWWLEKFERKEVFPGKGALTFLVGVILVVWLFERNVALAAIMILTLGDSISHYVGRFYGKVKNPLNNLRLIEGTVLGTLFAFLGAMFFVIWWKALIASFIAMVVEAIDMRLMAKNRFFEYILDDNILIPLVSGVILILL